MFFQKNRCVDSLPYFYYNLLTMTTSVRISSKRQITIPSAVFSSLGLSQGDILIFEVKEDKITVQNAKNALQSLAGSLTLPKELVHLSTEELIQKAKKEHLIRKFK